MLLKAEMNEAANGLSSCVRIVAVCYDDIKSSGYTALLIQIALFGRARHITLPRGGHSAVAPTRDKLLSCR